MFPSHTAWHHHKYSAGKQSRAGQSPPLKPQPVKWLHSGHTHHMGKQSPPLSSQVVPKHPGGLTLIHAERALPRHKETRGANRPMFSYCPNNSPEHTESLHKGSYRKMQKYLTIRVYHKRPAARSAVYSQLWYNPATGREPSSMAHGKTEARDPAKTDAPAESAWSQQANIILSEHSYHLEFSEINANPRSELQNATHLQVCGSRQWD